MSEKKRFLLRCTAEIYSAIEKWAADDLRSVNGQIEFILTEAVRKTGRLKQAEKKRQDHQAGGVQS